MKATTNRRILPLDPVILARFQQRMYGELFSPDAAAVATTRGVHDQTQQEPPVLIARCLNAYDVALALALAREFQLELGVHPGSHSHFTQRVRAGYLLVDLSQMRQITLDPLQRIARVQPGVTHVELAQAAAAHGLATTMDGSADKVLAFELVFAEGTIITVSAHEHSELFAAVREGSNMVGVVTAVTYRLHLSPPEPEIATGDSPWI